MAKERLLLFDIDGTLLTTGQAGVKALRLAIHDVFCRDDDLARIEIAGRTDSGIARQLFQLHGIEQTEANLARFYAAYLKRLPEQLQSSEGQLLPGVAALLTALKPRSDVVLALLTGNLARGAELKLTHYGVWHFFEFGAFADDHHERNELGPFAWERAHARHGVRFTPEQTFIIGDTPHDVGCGQAIGARTLAVATGNYSAQQLAACGAGAVLNDLSNTREVLAFLTGS